MKGRVYPGISNGLPGGKLEHRGEYFDMLGPPITTHYSQVRVSSATAAPPALLHDTGASSRAPPGDLRGSRASTVAPAAPLRPRGVDPGALAAPPRHAAEKISGMVLRQQ